MTGDEIIEDIVNSHAYKLNAWESEFMESMWLRSKSNKEFTDKMLDKINQIYNKVNDTN